MRKSYLFLFIVFAICLINTQSAQAKTRCYTLTKISGKKETICLRRPIFDKKYLSVTFKSRLVNGKRRCYAKVKYKKVNTTTKLSHTYQIKCSKMNFSALGITPKPRKRKYNRLCFQYAQYHKKDALKFTVRISCTGPDRSGYNTFGIQQYKKNGLCYVIIKKYKKVTAIIKVTRSIVCNTFSKVKSPKHKSSR